MRTIVRMRFGSQLYGTATPASDVDLKSVFIPDARLILLQRVKSSVSTQRPKDAGEKNYAGEIDEEAYALQRYLGLLAEGQTVALDMLFAPADMLIDAQPAWWEIQENRHKLLTRKSASFIGYCRQQANKYGIKGSRIAAASDATALFAGLMDDFNQHTPLSAVARQLEDFATTHEHCAIVELEAGNSPGRMIKHFECCGRKTPWTVPLIKGYELYKRIFEEYGSRARQAQENEGVDWKALSHAVRVGYEALELMKTGNITFPLPNREHILAIKLGKIPYSTVAAQIEVLLQEVEQAESTSILPEKANTEWIDDYVVRTYASEVFDRFWQ